MIAVIAMVCVFDVYLAVKYHDSLVVPGGAGLEQNPMAAWLVDTREVALSHYVDDNGRVQTIVHKSLDVSSMILVKMYGSLFGVYVLAAIERSCSTKFASWVVGGVFAFQICLFVYLVA